MHHYELGTRRNPVKIFLTPSVDTQTVVTNAQGLTEFLNKRTGYYFEVQVPSSYIAVVEAFGSKKTDIAIMNTFSYLLARKKYGAVALLRVVRAENETTYKGQIIVRADSGIRNLKELQGKRIAFVDPSSTSGYLLPKALLRKAGVLVGEEIFAMRHDNVVTMVYQKQVDAGATYYALPDKTMDNEPQDARQRVKKQFPDVMSRTRIIGFTDEIPNDPLVFRTDMPDEMKKKVVDAFMNYVLTSEGREALNKIYGVTGLIPAQDSDYNIVRDLISQQNILLEELIK